MNYINLCNLLPRCNGTRQLNQCHAQIATCGLLSDIFLINNLIRAHARTPAPYNSVSIFCHVHRSGLSPDPYTFPALLKACSLAAAKQQGLSAHACALKLGLDSCIHVKNALMHFHCTVGNILGAQKLLDACEVADTVSYNTLITGYARTGDLDGARKVFDKMPVRDDVSWCAMISGYVQAGLSDEGLEVFSRMQAEGFNPGRETLVAVLSACAHLGELDQGRWVHRYIKNQGIRINVYLGTSLIDMYCKCGEVGLGMEVFSNMPDKNLLAWTTIIRGLAMHGKAREALELFYEMEKSGILPDDIAFLGALCACTHAGLVYHGKKIFESMTMIYDVQPKLEHYGCMIDLLARNGMLGDAMDLVNCMPMQPDAMIWGSILAGCRFYGNVDLAEAAVKYLIHLEAGNSGVYVLLASIYSASGRHEAAKNIRQLMQDKGIEKTPGCSSLELRGVVHQFFAGDYSHPQMAEIMVKWKEIEKLIRLEGYIPDKQEVLLDVDEEEKDGLLAWHSEKLAIAFALINTNPGTVIRIIKNLRVCGDCHNVIKLVSKVYNRRIIVRDRTRFHIFEDGSCNCNDYW